MEKYVPFEILGGVVMSVMTPVAVVTGGASGIGEACARRFSKEGYHVAILDVDVARAAEVAKGIEESGGVAVDFQCDVTNAKSLDDLARRIETEIGPVEVLVTSAGILHSGETLLDMDLNAHDHLWRVNYHGTVHACRSFGKIMTERKRGAIVTVGSITGFAAFPLPAYSPSKTATMRLTEILAVELGRFGVRVNGVAPTYVLTPALKARIDAGERDPQTILHTGALEMFVEPHQVAAVAAFLCSEQAAAITGVMLPVDAGWGAAVAYKSYAGGVPWEN